MPVPKKILLLYISALSGHHRAAMAIDKALKSIDPLTQTSLVNSFNYTNPILEKIINRTYMGIIKRTPEVWEYLYDNPRVVRNTQRLKEIMHRYNSAKMSALIDEFKPDVIACTQAFPCGMIADYKSSFQKKIPLVGVLTDFYPHSYWIYKDVDRYVVASEDAKVKLVENGVSGERISVLGVPIDISFNQKVDRSSAIKSMGLSESSTTLLIMGGSTGLGPIRKIVHTIDRINADIQTIVVTGTNAKLYSSLKRAKDRFRKKLHLLSYVDNMNELMSAADIIITKPGGLTVSEALAKGLPIIIINPIPGQEAKNTQFLLQRKAAVKADNEYDVAVLVDNLCSMPSKLSAMKAQAALCGRPNSALDIANLMLEL